MGGRFGDKIINSKTLDYLARFHFHIQSSLNNLKNELREYYQLGTSDVITGGIHRNILAEHLVEFKFDNYAGYLDLKGQLALKITREDGRKESVIIGFNQHSNKINLVYLIYKDGKSNIYISEIEEGGIYGLKDLLKDILLL